MHRRWMAGLRFEQAAHQSCWKTASPRSRRRRCDATVWKLIIEAALPDWSLAPVVRALQALRGMALVAAATVIAELGDITRFANPASSWSISVWFRLSTRAGPHDAKVASRKPEMARPDEC